MNSMRHGLQSIIHELQPMNHGLRPMDHGLQPKTRGLQPMMQNTKIVMKSVKTHPFGMKLNQNGEQNAAHLLKGVPGPQDAEKHKFFEFKGGDTCIDMDQNRKMVMKWVKIHPFGMKLNQNGEQNAGHLMKGVPRP